MLTGLYWCSFIFSLFFTFLYMLKWHKHFNVTFTLMNVLIPISNLGFLLLIHSQSIEEAMIAHKFYYIGGIFIQPIAFISILSMCKFKRRKWYLGIMFAICVLLYGTLLTTEKTGLYYKDVWLDTSGDIPVIMKEYGPVHTLFYIVVGFYSVASIAMLIYSVIKKRQISRKVIGLMLAAETMIVISYFARSVFRISVELVPIGFCISQLLFLLITNRVCLYDTESTIAESHTKNNSIGYFSFDTKMNFLGCNKTAIECFPEFEKLEIDRVLTASGRTFEDIYTWIDELNHTGLSNSHTIQRADKIYKVTCAFLIDDDEKKGYQFVIEDDTQQQKYIELINNYNSDLKQEVQKQTQHIRDIQDKMVLGMAELVEQRDNSTGGHIKRTSQVVRILMDEIMRDGSMGFDERFYQSMIKAAPMHDLGKIAVDDDILRKPGRYTEEEYEIMKTHAKNGATIVKQVLEGINDPYFEQIAENVAHYHHERVDGSGYPCGLKGDEIPVEARIMAIADVYDALVSKRCYKDKMSFEKAFEIIEEGMGKHFDPIFNPFFVHCRSRLESYYTGLE